MLLFPTNNLLQGLFITWNVVFDAANATSFQGKLPDLSLISTLFNMFMKPYLKTWPSELSPRAFNEFERTIEKVVRLKVKQLQPFLQDDDLDEAENEITFEGNDETTIVEFVPQMLEKSRTTLRNGNDTFKANMQKYKKVRNKIYKALDEEMVSDETKTLVMRTLDELLGKMVETQCHWKGGTEIAADDVNSQLIVPRTIINMWKNEWHKFKTKFSTMTQPRATHQFNNFTILMKYLTKLNSIINDISMNLESFAKKYKVSCNISERNNFKKNHSLPKQPESIRLSYDTERDKALCKNFKVCSKELKTFFIDFYNIVNDTTLNVLRSYAEMFIRDVNTDVSNEKSSIVELIFGIGDQAEKNIIKIFVNYTTHFHLDEHKGKDANLNYLLNYIKKVINQVKEDVYKDMLIKFNHLHKKMSSSIQQDVEVNLGIDLENLKRELTDKICLMFDTCNGNNMKTRRYGAVEKENTVDNENKIYVKVELTIDKEYDDLLRNSFNISTARPLTESGTKRISSDFTKFRSFKTSTALNYKKYANISVTRTTLKI